MIHWSPATVPPISRWIVGRATLTIVTSSWMTKKPRQMAARVTVRACGETPPAAARARSRRAAVVAGTAITPERLVGWAAVCRYPALSTLRAGSDKPGRAAVPAGNPPGPAQAGQEVRRQMTAGHSEVLIAGAGPTGLARR